MFQWLCWGAELYSFETPLVVFFLFAPEAIDKDTESNLQLLDCNSAALKTLLIKELGKSLLGW